MIRDITHHGLTVRAAAAARSVSERTGRRWFKRAEQLGFPALLHDLSSAPLRQPKRTPKHLQQRVCSLRRKHRLRYWQLCEATGLSRATVHRILKRNGLNRLEHILPSKPPRILRYERGAPGELIHLDIKKLGRFHKPGVRATGNRADRNQGAGTESLHVAIDDHSRLGFATLLKDEKTPRTISALCQTILFFARHQIKVSAVMTDNGPAYRSHHFASACLQLGLKHIFTRKYRPQTNGKAERFIQTLCREWAYAHSFCSSLHRKNFLPHYLNLYNSKRPHSALNYTSPSSRIPDYADNVSRLYS